MTDDLISRQAAVAYAISGRTREFECEKWIRVSEIRESLKTMPPAEPRWIPIKTRPMDEEERAYYAETLSWELTEDEAVVFTCEMPEDGQEVWVCSKCGNVWQDTCVIDEGIGLEGNGDWLDIVAWMPFRKPTPWKGESDERTMPL